MPVPTLTTPPRNDWLTGCGAQCDRPFSRKEYVERHRRLKRASLSLSSLAAALYRGEALPEFER